MSQLPISPQGTPPILIGRLQAMLRGLKGDKGETGDVTPEAVAAKQAAEIAAGTATTQAGLATAAKAGAEAARDEAVPAAATATTQAGVSTTKAGEASASAAASAISQASAANSAQGAMDASGLFVDLTAFGAAVVDNKMGGIKSADPDVAYALAQKVAGVSSLTGAAVASKAFVDRLASVAAGGPVELDAPNLVPVDWRTTTVGAVNPPPVSEVKNGFSCLKVPATLRRIVVSRSAVTGSTFDASVILVAKEAGANCRLLVRQMNGFTEITGARQTYSASSSAVGSAIYIEFKAVAIDAACTDIELFMDTGSAVNSWWALPTIAQPTGNARHRPKWTEKAVSDALAANAAATAVNASGVSALRGAIVSPNLWRDPYFSNLSLLTGTAATAVVELLNGIPALKIVGTTRTAIIRRSAIRGSTMSASVYIPQRLAGASARVLLQQFAPGGEIGGTRQTYNIDTAATGPLTAQFNNVAIDAACTYVAILLDPGASTTWFTRLNLAADTVGDYRNPETTPGLVYLSKTGADTNPGTKALPFATTARAIAALKGVGTIVVRGALDYTDGYDLAGASTIKIAAHPGERVRMLLGTLLTGVTKTGGYTRVYQAALAEAPWGQHIFEHETPEGLIPASERQALQHGRTHRNPSTRIWKVGSIAAVDAATRPSWFWASGVIYLSAADLGDATMHTYYSTGPTSANGCANGTDQTDVEMEGIEAWYGYNNFRFSGCRKYKAVDLYSFGAASNGIASDGVGSGEEIRCEDAASGNDGAGAHNSLVPPAESSRDSLFMKVNNWSHDNYDDGDSGHERTTTIYFGGLYEYNGDKGIAPAAGAHVVGYGVYSRKNGQNTRGVAGTGYGFGVVLDAEAGEGGVGTQAEWWNCISDQDNHGFAGEGLNTTARMFGCRTINSAVSAYYADRGALYLQDARDSGSAVVKQTVSGGTIDVSNGTTVT